MIVEVSLAILVGIAVGVISGHAIAMVSLLLFEDQMFGFLDRISNLFRSKRKMKNKKMKELNK